MRKSYTDKAAMARPYIAALLKLVPTDKQEEALFHAANIFLKGNQANPRACNATMKSNAIKAAFAEHPTVKPVQVIIRGNYGKSFTVVNIEVPNYRPIIQEEQDSDEE